jgi:hypothetical protein
MKPFMYDRPPGLSPAWLAGDAMSLSCTTDLLVCRRRLAGDAMSLSCTTDLLVCRRHLAGDAMNQVDMNLSSSQGMAPRHLPAGDAMRQLDMPRLDMNQLDRNQRSI